MPGEQSPWKQFLKVNRSDGWQEENERKSVLIDMKTNALEQTIDSYEGIKVRAFPAWPANVSLPCFDVAMTDKERPYLEGFLFVKTVKAGSSFGASVGIRIAKHVGKAQNMTGPCKVAYTHGTARVRTYAARDPGKSFLFSIIGDPAKRAISEFFHYQVSRRGVSPTDGNFVKFLETISNFELQYLSTVDTKNRDPVEIANRILNEYNFIMVTERMDESAVALQLLLGLDTSAILYLSSELSGGYDDGTFQNKCFLVEKSFVSKDVQSYLDSPAWKDKNHGDSIFYQAVNRRLDLTIEHLGQRRFEIALERFRRVQKRVNDYCGERVRLPCSASGEKRPQTDCVWGDSGCGLDCIDEVVRLSAD